MINPISTTTTPSINVTIVDNLSFAIINQISTGLNITTNQPFPIKFASVVPQTYEPGVPTFYNISFKPEHTILP